MTTDPKMLPCPYGHSADYLSVYKYEGGWQHVECNASGCNYLGPASGSRRIAIKLHNEHVRSRADAMLAAREGKDNG